MLHDVTVLDVTHFVREHRDDFFVVFSQLDQFVGEDYGVAREGEGVGAEDTATPKHQPTTHRRSHVAHHLVESHSYFRLSGFGNRRRRKRHPVEHHKRVFTNHFVHAQGQRLYGPFRQGRGAPEHERSRYHGDGHDRRQRRPYGSVQPVQEPRSALRVRLREP